MGIHKNVIRISAFAFIMLIFVGQSTAQRFNSAVGVRLGYETAELSAKIGMTDRDFLDGTIGVVTPQPDYTVGAGIAYHRHIGIAGSEDFAFYYGAGVKGVIGDESGFGVNAGLGLIYVYKSINIGLDVMPTYFFNDVLGFRPLAGIHLRWVND